MSVGAMDWVFKHSRAEHSARLVLLSLANHAGEPVIRLQWTPGGPRPEPFPTIVGLADRTSGQVAA